MRFELIDKVLEQSPDCIVAAKNVTSAEEYLADHFPSFAVLPGVMMLETLVQAGRLLLADAASKAVGQDAPLVLAEVRNVRYGNMVRPGETLTVQVTVRPGKGEADPAADGWDLNGVGRVTSQDGSESVAVQGRFRLIPLACFPATV